MKYIYGPVQSRRLGLSLGVSLVPHKTCNFDCVYCQLGPTIEKAREQKEYVKIEDILTELKEFIFSHKEEVQSINYITLSGSGEPVLNTRIGELIQEIKKFSSLPIAVISNSSLLVDDKARQGLSQADLIVPSLDAATQEVFVRINNPADNIKIGDIIDSLIKLRREFRGKMWLEIMLAKGINDSLSHIKKLKEITDRINPDKIQLNSPVRTTAYAGVRPVGRSALEKIQKVFGDRCEII